VEEPGLEELCSSFTWCVHVAPATLQAAGRCLPAGGHAMFSGIPNRGRRAVVSLSTPVPNADLIDQLDRIVEILHQVNLTLPKSMLGCRSRRCAVQPEVEECT
jgi:hypothetical protein